MGGHRRCAARVSTAVALLLTVSATGCTGDDDGSRDTSAPAVASSAAPAEREQRQAAVTTLVATGLEQLGDDDRRGAAATFDDVLALDPTNVYALYNLGYLAQLDGDEATAVARYTRAVESDKNFGPALYNLAILTEIDDLPGAVALYRRVLEVTPEDPATLVRLGYALEELGRTQEGRRLRARGIELNPALADAPAPSYG